MASRRPGEFGELRAPDLPPGVIRLIAAGILIFIVAFTSFFTVQPEEVGIILRFGKFVRVVESGLHFKMPFGVEQVRKVPVERQLKDEFGFRTLRAGRRTEYDPRSYSDESLMLTGDLNAAEVEWIVQYRVSDPYKFLFRVRNARQTFRDMNEALMREIIGDRTVNEVLTIGRTEIAAQAETGLQELADQYELGVKVDQVVLQDVNPPDRVKPAFNEVNESEQEKERLINVARSDYNKVIPKARGEAERAIQEAVGYAQERINEARGDSARFMSLYREYAKAREVTKQRIYIETMNEILPKVGQKFIMDKNSKNILPLLNLDGQLGGKK